MNQTGNLDLIKRINRSLVLEMIRHEQPISRAAIAKRLGLSRSTVSLIVDDLMAKKFVVELGYGDSTKGGGRRGIELGFNPKSAFGVGVEIGDKGILHVITDLSGEILKEERIPLTSKMDEIIKGIQEFLKRTEIDQQLILGLGITVPSIVNIANSVVIDAPLLGWKDINIKQELQSYFPFPIFVNNDVNSAALGERWLGKGKETKDLFYIAFGSGVGSAIIANGELIFGHSYSAGEIGFFLDHQEVKEGVVNQKGRYGALESKINNLLLEVEGMGKSVNAMQILTDYLSITLANVVSLLNPEKVILGGPYSLYFEPYIKDLEKRVSELSTFPICIEIGCIGEHAAALGAIHYVFEQIKETI